MKLTQHPKIGRNRTHVRRATTLVAGLLLATSAGVAAPDTAPEQTTAITIYSTGTPGAISADLYRPRPQGDLYGSRRTIPGFAVIKQERVMPLASGRSEVRFTDVAALIEPTTVSFRSLTDPEGTRVLEQNYQFDLVSGAKLLERYLDREITVEQAHGDNVEQFIGTLLSASGGLILKGRDGNLVTLNGYSNIRFPELPGGLMTRPTLVWDVLAEKAADHRVRVTYQTDGLTWWADYNLIFTPGRDPNHGLLDVNAWVSILNQSGGSYDNAKLKLIAGDVHRAKRTIARGARVDTMQKRMAAAPAGFEEKSFFEYHLYTLGRATTLPDNSTKQIELFDAARDVDAKKLLVYRGAPAGYGGYLSNPATDRNYGTHSNPKVDIYLDFRNSKENGLGIPLPSGRIRVSQLDPDDGTLEFIGEDTIDHTAKNEEILIQLGSAFDVVGERKQLDFRVDTARRWMEEEIEIKLRNHKEESVDVLIKENLYRWVNWEILSTSHDYDKQDSRTVHFPVRVDADGEVVVRYRVRYTW